MDDRDWLAGVWLLGFWLVGWAAFDRAYVHHELVLARPGEARTGFHGAVYALDTLAARGRLAPASGLDSPRRSAVVGVGVDPGRLDPHHRGGGSPQWAAQTRLAGHGVDQMWTKSAGRRRLKYLMGGGPART